MTQYNFQERLNWSKGRAGSTDKQTIIQLLQGCVKVEEGNEIQDRNGIDFVAHLRRGAEVFIDVKRREKGVSRYWTSGPELTIERWSVCPSDTMRGVLGWTLDERKQTDYVLYLFDRDDCDEAFLIPFQLLRLAYRNNGRDWHGAYRVGRCSTDGRYETESVFVPANVVLNAVGEEMRSVIATSSGNLTEERAEQREVYQVEFSL